MQSTTSAYPSPTKGASLILSFRLEHKTTLIVGGGILAASRALAALEADSNVVIFSRKDFVCDELRWRQRQGQIIVLGLDDLPSSSSRHEDSDAQAINAYLSSNPGTVSFVCVTDTLSGTLRRSQVSAARIYHACKAHNVLVNVTDMPEYCDFSFTSTHRWDDPHTGSKSALQVGVTTNGQGCRLAGRIKREIVAALPKEVGGALKRVGELRLLAKEKTREVIAQPTQDETTFDEELEVVEDNCIASPNRPVSQRSQSETPSEYAKRCMKWVAQVSEYWPIHQLANMTPLDMEEILSGDHSPPAEPVANTALRSVHELALTKPPGRILLVGSGPGHPALLTLATHTALTKMADIVLSDKLVPSAVLDLIPPTVTIRIARKFPGNAEGAQTEMMEAAVDAAKKGLCVVRLKQGDPAIYGRFGEEVLYFRAHGFEPLVIPGVSSAIAAPTFAGIPVTQRGVAESLMVCTGVGRAGKTVVLPGYERGRTLVILMGVARLAQVIHTLTEEGDRDGSPYPLHLPIAIIERASMSDQRVITSTLKDIVRAMDSIGEQRPPAMMIVGWAALALWGDGDMSVLDMKDGNGDEERVRKWLGSEVGWRVREGLDDGWQYF
ncbi:hypothetical protein EYR40_003302 [Pleurotus pulmonarius]|nr:hypothetical protein EYR40_003302 [Pleurotus pulmonarius]KAF4606030.1 hypothetical protein EYR38_000075 [Pleurotus pulmonarius]